MNPIEPMAMSEAITIARRSSRKSPDPWRNCWLSCVGVIEIATHVGCRSAVARETNQLLLVELDCDRVHAITLFHWVVRLADLKYFAEPALSQLAADGLNRFEAPGLRDPGDNCAPRVDGWCLRARSDAHFRLAFVHRFAGEREHHEIMLEFATAVSPAFTFVTSPNPRRATCKAKGRASPAGANLAL